MKLLCALLGLATLCAGQHTFTYSQQFGQGVVAGRAAPIQSRFDDNRTFRLRQTPVIQQIVHQQAFPLIHQSEVVVPMPAIVAPIPVARAAIPQPAPVAPLAPVAVAPKEETIETVAPVVVPQQKVRRVVKKVRVVPEKVQPVESVVIPEIKTPVEPEVPVARNVEPVLLQARSFPEAESTEGEEDRRLREHEEAKSAHYAFSSSVQDSINDHAISRSETRDGLALTGMYSYSDGFFKRTVHYQADENGYRVVK